MMRKTMKKKPWRWQPRRKHVIQFKFNILSCHLSGKTFSSLILRACPEFAFLFFGLCLRLLIGNEWHDMTWHMLCPTKGIWSYLYNIEIISKLQKPNLSCELVLNVVLMRETLVVLITVVSGGDLHLTDSIQINYGQGHRKPTHP